MSRKKIFYIIFFIVLALGFYFTLILINPDIGKKKFPPISYVRPFEFTNQDGEKFTNENVKGKVYVAEFFFTTCPGICPDMNRNMRIVYEEFKDEPGFLILAHTSDPDTDSVSQLRAFADEMKVNTDRWVFVTGRKDSLYNMARQSYTIDDPKNNLKSIDDQFLHSQFFSLVDRQGNVLKIYDGLKQSEVRLMIKEIKKLLKEKG
jgi:protein SCO1/2